MNKKVLLAGGAGYIGSRLAPRLLERGDNVTIVDLLWFGNNLPEEVRILQKDIFHLQPTDLEGFDAVVFLGGLSNDPMAEFSPALNYISNAASPAYLAHIAKQAGVPRYVYGSSCSVYGLADQDMVTEDVVPNSRFPYGASKLAGELAALQLVGEDNFSVISLRQGTISGSSPRMRFDLLFNTMYMKAATEGKITVNNPEIWRPVLAMEDVVKAYQCAIDASPDKTGVYNLASTNYTIGDAGEDVRTFFNEVYSKDIEIETHNIPDKRNYRVSAEKAKNVLGVEFTGSVRSILEDLHENIGLDYDFGAEKHYNIKVFEKLPKNFSL